MPELSRGERSAIRWSDAVLKWGLVSLVAFTPLAFGTVEGWSIALMEWGVASLLLVALARRILAGPGESPEGWKTGVEWPLGLFLVLVLLQVIPLPRPLVAVLAPGSASAHAAGLALPSGGVATRQDDEAARAALGLGAPPAAVPVSLDVEETVRRTGLLLTFAGVFYLAAGWGASRGRARFLLRVIVVVGFAIALFAIVQRLTWNGRIYWLRAAPRDTAFGPFVNHNHFAGYVEMILPLAIALAYFLVDRQRHLARPGEDPPPVEWSRPTDAGLMDDRQERAGRWGQWLLALFTAILILAALVLSGSRGGLLSAVLSGGLLFAALWKRIRPRALAWGVVVALPLTAALLIAWIGVDTLRAQIPEGALEREASFHARQVIWRQVVNHLPEAGAAGFGLGSFETSFAPYTPPGTAARWDKAHNDFLQVAWETGIVGGLLIALGALLFGIRYILPALRSPDHESDLFRIAIAVGLTSLVLHSFVDFNLQIGSNWFLFALLAGLLVALHRSAAERARNPEIGPGPRLIDRSGDRIVPLLPDHEQEPAS
jgi:hypothetical protein